MFTADSKQRIQKAIQLANAMDNFSYYCFADQIESSASQTMVKNAQGLFESLTSRPIKYDLNQLGYASFQESPPKEIIKFLNNIAIPEFARQLQTVRDEDDRIDIERQITNLYLNIISYAIARVSYQNNIELPVIFHLGLSLSKMLPKGSVFIDGLAEHGIGDHRTQPWMLFKLITPGQLTEKLDQGLDVSPAMTIKLMREDEPRDGYDVLKKTLLKKHKPLAKAATVRHGLSKLIAEMGNMEGSFFSPTEAGYLSLSSERFLRSVFAAAEEKELSRLYGAWLTNDNFSYDDTFDLSFSTPNVIKPIMDVLTSPEMLSDIFQWDTGKNILREKGEYALTNIATIDNLPIVFSRQLKRQLGYRLYDLQALIRSNNRSYNLEKAVLNGLMTAEDIIEYLKRNPLDVEKVKDIDKIVSPQTLRELLANKKQFEAESRKKELPLLEAAKEHYSVKAGPLSTYSDIMKLAKDEAVRLGLSAEDVEKFAPYVTVYKVDKNNYSRLARQYEVQNPFDFLGVDLSNKEGVFHPNLQRMDGSSGPTIILCATAEPNVKRLMEAVNLHSYQAYPEVVLAHEVAHWLYDMRTGGVREDYDPTNEKSALQKYFESVSENVAYAHGELPAFLEKIMEQIPKVIQWPHIQEAIRDWFVYMMTSSEDAATLGIMNAPQILAEAERLRKAYKVDITQYLIKKMQRQTNLVAQTVMEMQRDYKQNTMRALLSKIKEIDIALIDPEAPDRHELKKEKEGLQLRLKNIMKGGLDIDPKDAAEAITLGFIREYFQGLLKSELPSNAISPPTLTNEEQAAALEHANYIMDATFGDPGDESIGFGSQRKRILKPRPLTYKDLPIVESPEDNLESYKKLIPPNNVTQAMKLAQLFDNALSPQAADKIESAFYRFAATR